MFRDAVFQCVPYDFETLSETASETVRETECETVSAIETGGEEICALIEYSVHSVNDTNQMKADRLLEEINDAVWHLIKQRVKNVRKEIHCDMEQNVRGGVNVLSSVLARMEGEKGSDPDGTSHQFRLADANQSSRGDAKMRGIESAHPMQTRSRTRKDDFEPELIEECVEREQEEQRIEEEQIQKEQDDIDSTEQSVSESSPEEIQTDDLAKLEEQHTADHSEEVECTEGDQDLFEESLKTDLIFAQEACPVVGGTTDTVPAQQVQCRGQVREVSFSMAMR